MEKTTNSPYLSTSPDLASLDPAWSTCTVVDWGAFDPPVALHTATALVQDPSQKSPPTPAPGSPIAPPHAPATPTILPVDPGKPAPNTSVPKADPEGPEQQDPHSSDPVKTSADDPDLKPQGHGSQSTKVQHFNAQDSQPQNPNAQEPKTHNPSPQDPTPPIPSKHNAKTPDPIDSPNGKNDGYPTNSANTPAAKPIPQNEVDIKNQGDFGGKSLNHQTSTNQPAGRKKKRRRRTRRG